MDLRRLVGLLASPMAGGDGRLFVMGVAAGAEAASAGLGTGVAGVTVTLTGLVGGRPTGKGLGREAAALPAVLAGTTQPNCSW